MVSLTDNITSTLYILMVFQPLASVSRVAAGFGAVESFFLEWKLHSMTDV
jgi:hypothetical protein